MHIVSLDQILLWISQYKYWIIFPLTIVEGPIITIISAFLASQWQLNVATLFLVALSGDMVGDSLYYAFGRWFYEYVLVRYEKRFRETGEKVEWAIEYLRTNPGKSIVFGKWTQVAGFAILIGAGAARVPLQKFFGYCVIWTAPKLLAFIVLGYLFGSAYAQIDTYLGKVSLFALVVLGSVAIYFLYGKRSSKWKK